MKRFLAALALCFFFASSAFAWSPLSPFGYGGSPTSPNSTDVLQPSGGGSGISGMRWAHSHGGVQAVSQSSATPSTSKSNGTDTSQTYRLARQFPNYTYDLKACFPNFGYASSTFVQTGVGNAITIKAAFECNSTYYPITFSGQTTASIPDGGEVCSDTIPVDIAAGSTCYFRTMPSVASGQFWPKGFTATAASSYSAANADLVNGTGALATANAANGSYGPHLIFGSTYPKTSPTVCIVGDSISSGTGDIPTYYEVGTTNPVYASGFMARGLGGYSDPVTYSWVQSSVGGTTLADRSAKYTNQSWLKSMSLCSYAIIEAGINEIGAENAETMKAEYIALANKFVARGIPVYQTTLTPSTTSTDYYQTTANQTVTSSETTRTTLNTWKRTNPSPFSGVIDVAATVECNEANVPTPNGGRWCLFATSPDVSGTATSANSYSLTDSTKSWTTNQWRNKILLTTGGTGAGQALAIQSNTATIIYINGGFSPTPDNTTTYIIQDLPTIDGVHPSPTNHIRMAVPVAETTTNFVRH